MSLADFTPQVVTVTIKAEPRTVMTVRGLSLEDLSILINGHVEDLQKLYRLLTAESGNPLEMLNVDGFILKLVMMVPVLAARAIAVASDEPGEMQTARRLPLPIQARVIHEIVRMTFEDVGGPKAFVALVGEMIGMPLPEAVRKATIQ